MPEIKDSTNRAVVIPADVYHGIELIRRSGVTNMTDRKAVQFYADRRNLYATVCWLEENREDYFRGIMRGFEPDRPLTDEEQDTLDEESEPRP